MGATNLNRKAADLLDALREALKPKADVIPPGWYSLNECARKLRVRRRRLPAVFETVGAERRSFRVLNRAGRICRTDYYHLPT